MNPPTPIITAASVRVMRSFDYNHFEITLHGNATSPAEADALRKEANRLADKAVAQFQIAKACRARRDTIREPWRLKQAQQKPEGERTPEDKAVLKYHQDAAFAARFDYDYEDDWQDDLWPEDEEDDDTTPL